MNILVVEDESRIAKRILRMTKDFFLDILEQITHLDTLEDGIDYIKKNSLDLVLLDLNLNGEDGFELLKSTASASFHTIIISAHKDQALLAFEYGVLDFVSKPFNKIRLNLAFDRVLNKEILSSQNIKVLAVKKRGEIQLINLSEISFIKGAGVYSELILYNGHTLLHDKSLEKLAQLLPKTFIRIHKSYLVRISEIKNIKINSGSSYIAELKSGEIFPIGRTRYKELKEKCFL